MGVVTCQFTSTFARNHFSTFCNRVQLPTFDSPRNNVKLQFRYTETKSYFQLYCITAATRISFLEKKMVGLQEIYQAPATTVQCRENGFLSLTSPTHTYRVGHTEQAYPCNKRHFIGTVSTFAGGIKNLGNDFQE